MPAISKEKIKKIKESIIFYLFNSFPQAVFTSKLAEELVRDEEFVKKLLFELEKENLVIRIISNQNGKKYERRIRWTLSSEVYEKYKKLFNKSSSKDYF